VFYDASDDVWQWTQPEHVQMICTSLQIANYTSTSITHIFTRRMLPLPSNRVKALRAHTRQILKEHSNIMT